MNERSVLEVYNALLVMFTLFLCQGPCGWHLKAGQETV